MKALGVSYSSKENEFYSNFIEALKEAREWLRKIETGEINNEPAPDWRKELHEL